MLTVTLKVIVDDGELKEAEKSIDRLNKAANNVGNSGGSGGDTQEDRLAKWMASWTKDAPKAADGIKEAEAAIKDTTAASGDLAAGAGEAGGALSAMGVVAGVAAAAVAIVAVAIVAAAAVAIRLGQEVTHLAKEFADYALDVGKAAEETGLMTETVAALRHEAEAQGRSFSEFTGQIDNFRKTIGHAAAGSEDARKKLNLLGVDPVKAINNLDGAFHQASESILKTKDPIEQARLALAAFGPDGYKFLAFLKEIPGGFDEARKKSDEFGLSISDKDVQAAKEFTRAYQDIKAQVLGIAYTFGREFGPTVTGVLRDFGGWVERNRSTIKSWAESTGNFVSGVIKGFKEIIQFVDDHPILLRVIAGVLTGGGSELQIASFKGLGYGASVVAGYGEQHQPKPLTDRGSQLEGSPSTQPADPAALAAQLAEQEKRAKEFADGQKRDAAAMVRYWTSEAKTAESTLGKVFNDLKEKFQQTGDDAGFATGVAKQLSLYTQAVQKANENLDFYENEQAKDDKLRDTEKAVLLQTQIKREQEVGQKIVDIRKETNDAISKNGKKESADYLKNLEAEMNRAIEIRDARNKTDAARATSDHALTIISERQMIDKINSLELDSINFRRSELQKYLKSVTGNAEKEADVKNKIAVLDQEITQQQITNATRITDAEKRKQEALKKLQDQYKDFQTTLEDQLDAVNRGNRPLTVYEETLRSIQRDYQDLEPAQKQNLLDLAAQIDAVEELNKKHAELKAFFSDSLKYVFEGDFKGLIQSFTQKIKDNFIDKLSSVFATSILGFDPNQTDNPVAKPITAKIADTNKKLDSIIGLLGGSSSSSGLGGLVSSLSGGLGGSFGSGGGFGGTPSFGGGSGSGSIITLPNGEQAINVSGSGGILGNLKNLFSTGQGGLFAPRANEANGGKESKLGGILGGIGDIATLVGGVVGGRVGGIISATGTGLSIGAAFGPIGAVIGAAAGFLFGLFQGDPKKKADKQTNIPNLQKGFADASTQLNEILNDIRHLTIDPDEAIKRANDIHAQVASGFGITFESSKYQKVAQQQIAAKLAEFDREPDGLIAQIKHDADIARGAADRSKRILPEFAGGTYFADYFKPNGLLPGMFDGADNILAMISRGEMVLNPMQQSRVRALAGHDVFAGAGIPNYPRASTRPQMATGGIAGAGLQLAAATQTNIFQPNLTLIVQGVSFEQGARAYLQSDDGKRTLVKVIKEKQTDKTL